MKTKNEIKIKHPDYRRIQELSHCIDHTITGADFNTNYPNSYRINYVAGDIHRYFKCAGKYERQDS